MPTAEKEQFVSELQEKFADSSGIYFTDFLGLDVTQVNDLRSRQASNTWSSAPGQEPQPPHAAPSRRVVAFFPRKIWPGTGTQGAPGRRALGERVLKTSRCQQWLQPV